MRRQHNVIHSTRCTALSKAIVFQIPLGFVRTLASNINKMFFLLSDTKEAELAPKEKLNRLKNILEEMQMLNDSRPEGTASTITNCSDECFTSTLTQPRPKSAGGFALLLALNSGGWETNCGKTSPSKTIGNFMI